MTETIYSYTEHLDTEIFKNSYFFTVNLKDINETPLILIDTLKSISYLLKNNR